MKYGFFYNNCSFAIAESEEEKNFLLPYLQDAVMKELTDSQFENVKNYKCRLVIQDDVIIEETISQQALNNPASNFDSIKEVLKMQVYTHWVKKIDAWLKNNTESEYHSYWTNYRNKLLEVDIDAINFPINHETFMEWFNNQPDNPTKSPLQLP